MTSIFDTPTFQNDTQKVGQLVEVLDGIYYKVSSMNTLSALFKDNTDETSIVDIAFKELLVDSSGNSFTDFQENKASDVLTTAQINLVANNLLPYIQADDKKK